MKYTIAKILSTNQEAWWQENDVWVKKGDKILVEYKTGYVVAKVIGQATMFEPKASITEKVVANLNTIITEFENENNGL